MIFVPPDLPLEPPAGVPVGVVLEAVVAAVPVGLLVDDCGAETTEWSLTGRLFW